MASDNIMKEKNYTIYTYNEILPDFNKLNPQEQDLFLPNLATIIGRVYNNAKDYPELLENIKTKMLEQLNSETLKNIDKEKYYTYIHMLITNYRLAISLIAPIIDGGSRKKIKTYRKHRTRKHKKPKSHKKRKSRMGRSPHKTRR